MNAQNLGVPLHAPLTPFLCPPLLFYISYIVSVSPPASIIVHVPLVYCLVHVSHEILCISVEPGPSYLYSVFPKPL